jgi:hypothetical protein
LKERISTFAPRVRSFSRLFSELSALPESSSSDSLVFAAAISRAGREKAVTMCYKKFFLIQFLS